MDVSNTETQGNLKWTRSADGAILGVCKGIARALDLPVGLVRLVWLGSVLCFGAGFFAYLALAIALPRSDKQSKAMDAMIFGVCAKISKRVDLEVGIVRFLAILLTLVGFGTTLVGYIILYFVLDEKPAASNVSPANPPSTT